MEHFITTVFWTLILSSYFLEMSAVKAPVLRRMLAEIQCPQNSTFYAPDDVKEQCIASALDCAMRELNGTVRAECTGSSLRINQGFTTLNVSLQHWNSKHRTQTPLSTKECVCEAWPLLSFSQFLEKIQNLKELVAAQTAAST